MHATKHTINNPVTQTISPWERSPSGHPTLRAKMTITAPSRTLPLPERSAQRTPDSSRTPSPVVFLEERENLLRSNQELENFAACAAHDLKSPRHAAWGGRRSLQAQPEKFNDSHLHQTLCVIERNIKKSIQQVNDILSLAKLNQPQKNPRLSNLNKIVEHVLAIHADKIRDTRGKVTKMELPVIAVDEHRIFFVFSNIIENAIKYKDAVRTLEIEIGFKDLGTSYEFFVKDNGKGIPQYEIKNIFNLFATIPNSETPHSTGIGLSYCKKVINLHGGKIWAESDTSLGTTVKFTIPK